MSQAHKNQLYLATPVGMDMEEACLLQQALAAKFYGGNTAPVRLASEVYSTKFAEKGSWKDYITYVAQGVDFVSRKAIFPMICCVQSVVGRATAQIVAEALSVNRTVFLILRDGNTFHLHPIRDVQTLDDTDWKTGWSLQYSTPVIEWSYDDDNFTHIPSRTATHT